MARTGSPLYNNPANKYVAGFIASPAMNFTNLTIEEANGLLFVERPGMRIRVPEPIAARMHSIKGQPAMLGIRPEDLHMARDGDPADMSFEAIVEVAEQLGSEFILDVTASGDTIVASVEPTVRVNPEDKIRLGINPAGLRFFRADSGAAI